MDKRKLLLLGKAVPAWKPTDLAGLTVWFEASDITGKSDGDAVQSWVNKGSAGGTATTTDATTYIYKTNILNGKPAVYIQNAPTDFMKITTFDGATKYKKKITVVKVIAGTPTGTSGGAVLCSSSGSGTTGFWNYHVAHRFLPYNHAMLPSVSPYVGSNNWINGFTYNGTRIRVKANGNYFDTNFTSDTPVCTANFLIGGAEGEAANYRTATGYICEILVYNNALSDSDFDLVMNYMQTKYAVPVCTNRIFVTGDSLTTGYGLPSPNTDCWAYKMNVSLGAGYYLYQYGQAGQTLDSIETTSKAKCEGYYDATSTFIYMLLGGSNDIVGGSDATTVYNKIVAMHNARRTYKAASKTVAITIPDRKWAADAPTQAARRAVAATINTSIRENYDSFSDGLVDIAADARFQDWENTTYFSDGTHFTISGQTAIAELAVPVIRAIT